MARETKQQQPEVPQTQQGRPEFVNGALTGRHGEDGQSDDSSHADGATLIAGRVRHLIERHHAGDRHAAAAHLGVPVPALADVLSGQWERMRADVLAAVVRAYGVSAAWLVSFAKTDETRPRPASPVARVFAPRPAHGNVPPRLLQA
jgi:hypothetical protein